MSDEEEMKPVSQSGVKLHVAHFDRYDKRITISGGNFTVWVDNDDVPCGALEFAEELVKAWNERRSKHGGGR